uniref:Uncharacterized protein n=1 Tax=viral metagenome TaxID=1070528 RepID=A0A6H1ZC40_9ZZZZ
MEYVNLGKKEPSYDSPVEVSKKSKPQIYYPSFYCEKELPIGGKDVGKEITAVVKLKITSVEKRIKDGKEPKYDYRFDVLKLKFPGKDVSSVEGMKETLSKI